MPDGVGDLSHLRRSVFNKYGLPRPYGRGYCIAALRAFVNYGSRRLQEWKS
jgi:hypothetical protein